MKKMIPRTTSELLVLVEQLRIKLEEAHEAYFNTIPIMEDAEYDALRDELQALDADHPFLKIVGAHSNVGNLWPKHTHGPLKMGSQLKITDKEGLDYWATKFTTGNLIWSEKMDGSSIALTYEDGIFVCGASRGNGVMGDNLTPNIALVGNFPKEINQKGTVHIRGEVILPISTWAAGFKSANPRNAAAGVIRRKDDPAECKFLKIYVYDVLIHGSDFATKLDKFEFLKVQGFQVPAYGVVDVEGVQKVKDHYETELRAKLDYEIDGLIIEDNDLSKQAEVGEVDNRPKGQRAYKFASLGAYTELLDIKWQVGRTGRLSPVGILEPVGIGGVSISRVLLNNYDEVEKFKLGRGSRVFVSRQQDVIPKVLSADPNPHGLLFPPPAVCTSCEGTDIRKVGVEYRCFADYCPGQTLRTITHYMVTLDAKGFGDTYIEKMLDSEMITDALDLYNLTPEMVGSLPGLSEKVAQKFLNELKQKSVNLPLKTFVAALGFPLFGEGMTEKAIEGGLDTLTALRNATFDDFMQIHGFGDEIARAAVKGFINQSNFIERMLTKVTIAPKKVNIGGRLAGKAFCFTGYRDSDASVKIEALGGKITSSVTKATTHLVVADLETLSGKAQKARAAGLTILDPAQLAQMIG